MKIEECKVGMDVASRDNPRYTYRIIKVGNVSVDTITTSTGCAGIKHKDVYPSCLYPIDPDSNEQK